MELRNYSPRVGSESKTASVFSAGIIKQFKVSESRKKRI
jgi:hypothetical protein